MTHANILRTVKETNYLSITEQDTILGLSNYVFDAFMFDMFGSLLNGAKLVLIPKETVLDMARLSRVIERENISILMITTALFHLLVDLNPACLSTLRKIMFGGERASVEHVRKALQTVGKGKLLHMYGSLKARFSRRIIRLMNWRSTRCLFRLENRLAIRKYTFLTVWDTCSLPGLPESFASAAKGS